MIEQLELIKPKGPAVSAEDVQLLLDVLRNNDWLTAAQITLLVCTVSSLRWPDRKIRAVANASEGQVISGQNGYKLTSQASISEIQQAAGWLRHQANEMTQRALQIDRVYHRKLSPNAKP